ncbi:alginate export family protein [Halalkalibaculum sp. DA3122]|uniref:alginate export family protein n=1 Tax=Halalkalibaculum sp. DA3122 TaxID=3373607 RepID=UPI0037549CBB
MILSDTNKLYTFIFACLAFLLLADYALAQFTLSGELRPRTELRHGYKTLPAEGAEAAFFTEQRSRLNLDYSKELYEIGLSVQDVRIWGSTGQLNKTDGRFSVHQAWGQINFNKSLSLKAGRQELVYDDQRILGSVGWTAQGRSHDALLLKLDQEDWSLHGGFAFNQDNNPPEPAKLFDTYYSGVNNYKTLQYLWYHRELESTSFSILGLNNGVQLPDSTVNFTQTVGLTGTHTFSDFSVDATFYYQTGTDPANTDVSAMLASASLSYSGLNNMNLTLGADYLSGTQPDQADNHSFNPLYGTHHKFYGFMDYFYVGNPHNQPISSHNNSVGLVDLFVKSGFSLSEKSSLSAALHQFYSPVDIVDPNNLSSTLSSTLGTEIDLVFSHALSDEVSIGAGYSQLFGTNSLEAIKGGSSGPSSNWAWLMLSFNPVFISM